MKRLTTLLLAMALCLGSIGAAKADGVDIKVKGQWDFVFGYTDKDFRRSANGGHGRGFDESGNDGYRARNDRSVALQRVRTQIDFITSEYLSGVLMFEIGEIRWGSGGSVGRSSGGALDADGVNIETKRAYLDWIIPYTEVSVRMGLQYLALPTTALGNPVFGADVAGITVSSPITDWLSVVAFWARPFDANYRDEDSNGFNRSLDDDMDMFGLLLPMSFDQIGLSFTPWYVYANVGNASGFYEYVFGVDADETNLSDRYAADSGTKAWWAGANLGFTLFDPLEFNMDFMYGRLNRTDVGGIGALPRGFQAQGSGWYIGATLDYKLDFMTPGIFGWYASGDTKAGANANRIGRIPGFGWDDGFTATSFGAMGYNSIGNGNNDATTIATGAGTWGIGIQLADMSFIEDLSHTLRFAYYRGTNDSDIIKDDVNDMNWAAQGGFLKYGADPLYLTDDDSVFEINFDHQYKIYENLTMVLELGYIYLKSDTDTWRVDNTSLKNSDDAWKAELNFQYRF